MTGTLGDVKDGATQLLKELAELAQELQSVRYVFPYNFSYQINQPPTRSFVISRPHKEPSKRTRDAHPLRQQA